jgi:hypothetical protein
MRARYSLMFTFAIALLSAVLLFLVGPGITGTVSVPTTQTSATQPATEEITLPVPSPATTLARLKEAVELTIEDEWAGLGVSHRAYYRLQRQTNGFTGKASFEVGWAAPTAVIADVSVPMKAALEFFETLAQLPAVYGYYEPRIEHTDDYPSVSIEVMLPDQTVRFYSRSQGENNVPWGLDVKGDTFVINSDEPARALNLLRPYLKRDVLRKLVDEQFKELGMPDTGTGGQEP